MRAAAAALLLGVLGACAPQGDRPSGFGPVVRVCEGAACRDVETAAIRGNMPEPDRRGERQSDPDVWRGEDPAGLQAAAESGDARAAHLLGQVFEGGLGGRPRRPVEAARWYGRAAEAGNPWAQFRLAQLLNSGAAGRTDRAAAVRLTGQAAQGGIAAAAFNLGTLYQTGAGVPRDPAEALRWLTVAAEGGVPQAQYNLGLLYFRGDGTERRLFDALSWMRRAAQGGYRPAQKAVGRLYMTGLDTMGQDLQEARTWLGPVAAAGDREAQGWLRQIEQAEREEVAFRRQLQLQAQQTQALWASVALAALLAPPPVTVIVW